jgi:hypothetical protein
LVSRAPAALAAATIAVPLAATFVVCNYVSSGRVAHTEFNNQVLNTPFSLSLAREKVITTSAEMLLSPVPDLVPPIHAETRRPQYAAFNASFMKLASRFLPLTTTRSRFGYEFRGPADELAYIPAETSVWLGFLPHFLILVGIVQLISHKLPHAYVLFVVAFFCWVLVYTTQTRYIWWTCMYYAFPAVLTAAAIGPIWDFARTSRAWAGRILLAGLVALFASHALLAGNLLTFGMLRNIRFLWQPGPASSDAHPVDSSVADAIRGARKVYIPATHWEVLYWNLMRFNPAARYSNGGVFRTPSPDTLMLLSIPGALSAGTLAVRLPSGAPPALTYLGEADSDHIFAAGNRIEARRPERSPYALAQVTWRQDASAAFTGVTAVHCCVGLDPPDGVVVRYGLRSRTTGEAAEGKWTLPGRYLNDPAPTAGAAYDSLWIESRRVADPEKVTRTVYDMKHTTYSVGEGEEECGNTDYPGLCVVNPPAGTEPYDLGGKHYSVAWLGKETPFSVRNSGTAVRAVLELRLATFGKPHTAVLIADGHVTGPEATVKRVFWENGADTVRWDVTLSPGEHKFVLSSKDSADLLPGNRPVCFLLIDGIKVTRR